MPTDPLAACRERWRDAPPLTDRVLEWMLREYGHREDVPVSRLVFEILRLRTALHHATTDDSDDECPRSTGRRR